MINWNNPKIKLPKAGQIIWIILQHWKENNPLSYEIYAGEVWAYDTKLVVENIDFLGTGSQMWEFSTGDVYDCNKILAWAVKNEINVPKF